MEQSSTLTMVEVRKPTDSVYNTCTRHGDRRYGDHHLLYIMWRCGIGRVSRQALSNDMGIGEGSTRTAISELMSLGLMDSARKGVGLTESGSELMTKLHIIVPRQQLDGLVDGQYNVSAILCGGAPLMTSFISTRDAAMVVGAEGCIPFRIIDGNVNSPFYDFMGYEYPDLEGAAKTFRMVDGDAAVVCGASNITIATMSAFAGLLDLIRNSSVEVPWL